MKKYIVEFIGTFALVFCGTGAIIVNEQTNASLGLIGIALTFGIIISAMIYVFGNLTTLWIYLIAPTLGAIVAMFVWKGINKTE